MALWWYNRLPRPGVDLSALSQPYLRAMIDCYDALDRRLELVDLTTDFRVPVIAAISRARRTGTLVHVWV